MIKIIILKYFFYTGRVEVILRLAMSKEVINAGDRPFSVLSMQFSILCFNSDIICRFLNWFGLTAICIQFFNCVGRR